MKMPNPHSCRAHRGTEAGAAAGAAARVAAAAVRRGFSHQPHTACQPRLALLCTETPGL